jgi:hypothetical protein
MVARGPEKSASGPKDLKKEIAEIDSLKKDFDTALSESEKSGNFDKSLALKKQIDDRMVALKARVEAVQAFEPESTSERLDLEFAEKLFGRDYLGPETVNKVWGIEVPPDKVPEIPFSREELERAKELDQFLILRARNAPDGTPLSMLKMHELLNPGMQAKGRGKVLASVEEQTDQWKRDSSFFVSDTPVGKSDQDFAWALTAKKIVPGTTNQFYVVQTFEAIEYVKKLYMGQRLPDQYDDAVGEHMLYVFATFGSDSSTSAIKKELAGPNWRKYASQLTNLKINQLIRPRPAQAQFDVLTYYQHQNKRLLENTHTWTNAQALDGFIVSFGGFDARGAGVDALGPEQERGVFGVLISRTS